MSSSRFLSEDAVSQKEAKKRSKEKSNPENQNRLALCDFMSENLIPVQSPGCLD